VFKATPVHRWRKHDQFNTFINIDSEVYPSMLLSRQLQQQKQLVTRLFVQSIGNSSLLEASMHPMIVAPIHVIRSIGTPVLLLQS
jgi:hypothetical protein